ncbi:MAG TPA: hypothetical protein VJ673_09135 [Aromatoleum sp.]|uniref:hypothetical protein n=1 Tax=Aromatoleum sp. TaxID=2307007 RepID=UPI002B48A947|nr:hypothetical protein [Aromatoleum sp.]HJV25840.1 hypothetical protein [Aromatoleum sp.]
MMRRLLWPLPLVAALLAGPAASAVETAAPISEAEQRVFEDAHLDNLPATASLHYRYRRTEAGQPDVDDEVVLNARRDERKELAVQVEYLHGERHLVLPDVEHPVSNPLILYFLEADVRDMHRRLGGQENYFRHRIRLALAEGAQVSNVVVSYGGKTVPATRVEIRPYVSDTQQERMRGMGSKTYRFTLSPQVPGGVYELSTQVAPAAGGQPLIEEVVTLRSEAGGKGGDEGPRQAPGYMTEGK